MDITLATINRPLTRTTGYLRTVTSHSLQPYRGCSLGNSLCGVGCYVQHNGHVTRGRSWGGFLEVRTNTAEQYLATVDAERRWARRAGRQFGVFLSSSTEPFLPQEARYGVTRGVLTAMLDQPPDLLIVQTHSHRVLDCRELIGQLATLCQLRVHLSIETDRESLPGLPPHASSVERRFEAAARLKQEGIRTVVTVSPLLPIADPERFFARIAACADAVVLDHFIQGDGSSDGGRTLRTNLPAAMTAIEPASVALAYRDAMVEIARRYLPQATGVSIDGFAGRFLPA